MVGFVVIGASLLCGMFQSQQRTFKKCKQIRWLTMEFLNIHKFSNEADGLSAIAEINKGEGFPSENATTSSYTGLHYLPEVGHFIIADAITAKYIQGVEAIEMPTHKSPQTTILNEQTITGT